MNYKTPLDYFIALSAIPRLSGHEKAAADFVERIALENGCTVQRDDMHNLIVRKPASAGCESAPPVMLQGHLDMVGEKLPGIEHDFEKDPIRLIRDGDILLADGTTLGGDDGVAVAIMLCILTDNTLIHPELECVFTVQEETGLFGASALDMSRLRARSLINLDAGPEGIFITTCAGGCRTELSVPIEREAKRADGWSVHISGLYGGHSGTAISRQGGNAIVLSGILLDALRPSGAVLTHLRAGDKDNVIPSEADVSFVCEGDVCSLLEPVMQSITREWSASDPDIRITLDRCVTETALTKTSSDGIIDLLLTLPHGIMSYSSAMPGLAETSANLASVDLQDDKAVFRLSLRSSSDLKKEQLISRVKALARMQGGEVTESGKYPGWSYSPVSPLRDTAAEVFREVYGYEPKCEGIHAGLECGVFKGAIPDLDIIATGPLYGDMHMPSEWLSVSGLERCCKFVTRLLRRLAGQ